MNFTLKIIKLKSVTKIEGFWTIEDYRNLLALFDYPDALGIPDPELFEMLSLAISDYEPNEAAEVVLKYKLENSLNEGQIHAISHEMLLDKIAEEYPDISMHYPLFNINQLLHDSYNGKFPRTVASVIDFELSFQDKIEITKDLVLRTFSDLLTENCLIKRLFGDQLESSQPFKEAQNIIWELRATGKDSYQLLSSDYWINREDFKNNEFSGSLSEDEINQ